MAGAALADPGGEPNNTDCNGVGNPNSPCEPSDNGNNGGGNNGGNGGDGGAGGSGGAGGNGGDGGDSWSDSSASSSSVGVGVGVGIGVGGDSSSSSSSNSSSGAVAVNDNTNSARSTSGASVGDTSSSSVSRGGNATVGDTTATSISEGGRSTATGGNSNIENGAVQVDASSSYNYVQAASRAATSFSSVCTSGAAGQSRSGGISIAVTSTQCSYLMQADAYMKLGDRENAIKFVEKAAGSASLKGFMSNFRSVVTLGIL